MQPTVFFLLSSLWGRGQDRGSGMRLGGRHQAAFIRFLTQLALTRISPPVGDRERERERGLREILPKFPQLVYSDAQARPGILNEATLNLAHRRAENPCSLIVQ